VVHRSGGCKDIPGVMTYDSFEEIQLPESIDVESLINYGQRFNIQNSENQLLKALYG